MIAVQHLEHGCGECAYWDRKPRPPERPAMFGGLWVLNIDKAKRLVAPSRPTLTVPTSELANWVQWPHLNTKKAHAG